MTTKVTLPAEVAAAIESYVSQYGREDLLSQMFAEGDWGKTYEALNTVTPLEVAAALINGYEIAKTPEEELRDYYTGRQVAAAMAGEYEDVKYNAEMDGIRRTLSVLGIQIKGVNA